MKDTFFLLGAGLGLAGIAWAIWHFLGNDGYGALATLALIAAAADNMRLRRQLRAKEMT